DLLGGHLADARRRAGGLVVDLLALLRLVGGDPVLHHRVDERGAGALEPLGSAAAAAGTTGAARPEADRQGKIPTAACPLRRCISLRGKRLAFLPRGGRSRILPRSIYRFRVQRL